MKEQLKIKTIKKETVKSPFTNGYCNKYRLELQYNNNKYRFNFFDSVNAYNNHEKLNKDDALYSILMDSMAYDNCRDIDDFSKEFGYDKVSECLKAYNGCKDANTALHNMFTDTELDELQAEFAEY